MKAYGSIRASSAGQAVEGVGLDAQTARIEAWCVANDADLVGVYEDAGISGGKTSNRPGVQAALDAVCKPRGGVLVVYSLSLMARSTKATIAISKCLQKCGADRVSLSEKIDTTSASGKMVIRMLAVLAEFERGLDSERARLADAPKRAGGEEWAVPPSARPRTMRAGWWTTGPRSGRSRPCSSRGPEHPGDRRAHERRRGAAAGRWAVAHRRRPACAHPGDW